jgi:hypothetical protein
MMNEEAVMAVQSVHDIPRQLPDYCPEWQQVGIVVIVDSEYPSYVYLRIGEDISAFDMSTEYIPVKRTTAIFNELTDAKEKTHGPAIICGRPDFCCFLDHVRPISCPAWPTQAAEWPRRPRKYGWPTKDTITCIVKNGCDLVRKAHANCEQDEWEKENQWRISFSRAETMLLNSWTPIQQIVYHILRVVTHDSGMFKTTDDNGHQILSRYHIKTLMMWTCELKPSSWWQQNNIIQISAHLITTLLKTCESEFCSGYFIPQANLLERKVTNLRFDEMRIFTDVNYLTEWIIK